MRRNALPKLALAVLANTNMLVGVRFVNFFGSFGLFFYLLKAERR
jgi:hypothetical protein